RIVGARMQTDRAYYVEIDYERGLAIVGRDYVGGDVPSLAGSHPLASFSSVLAPLENGRPFVAADAATDPHISDVDRVACATRALRSFVAMPLIKAGQLVAAFCVTDAEPRTWAEDDVGLLHDVAERTWDAVERARAEAAVRESEVKLALDLADARRLQRVSTQLIQEDDIELLYAQIVDAAVALMRADCGSMQMFFPERNELLLLTEKGLAPESAAFWKWVRADSASVCGAALAGGKRVIVPDIETCAFMVDTDDLSYSRLSGIRAVQSTPLLSRDGRAVGMISTHWRDVHEPADRELRLVDVLARQAADLIERRRADEAVRESEQRLQRAIEIETVGVVYFRTDGAITYANDAFLRMSGYSRDDVARGLLRWDTTTPPEWMPATLRAMDELVESGRISPYEKEYLRKDGSRWWTLCAGTRLSEDEGVKFVLDLTEAKRLEAAHAAVLDAVAHDVKNPLTTIAGQAQLIERDLARDTIDLERVQGRAAAIAAGARRATDLLDDLTDAARLRVGKPLALQPAPVDLVSLVEAAATTQQSATDRHTIAVEAAVASLPGVWDAARIRRVLDNLLGNAIKYSPDGGPVTVRVRRDDGPDGAWAEVAVVDRGVGIPASDLPRIFEPFHRGGNVAQRIAGSGIGLNGARQIVEQHGGTIAATSVEGQGSVFTARLPLAPDAG
ncbi:MAG TPA: ATP-binding protein, partial [Thermomicrobiales bacterium]|nr:ATP-binding protein [Thermomicrobiales bacterium]